MKIFNTRCKELPQLGWQRPGNTNCRASSRRTMHASMSFLISVAVLPFSDTLCVVLPSWLNSSLPPEYLQLEYHHE